MANKAKQFHDMTTEELRGKLADMKTELFNLRFQQTTGQLKNPVLMRTLKKDVARVMTILRERDGVVVTKTAAVAADVKGGKK